MKRGQITVFIIIGIIILVFIGAGVYITSKKAERELEIVAPGIAKLPQQAQPLRDMVETCLTQLGTDGLRKIGDSGGYIDSTTLATNPASPTEGEAIELSPRTKPAIAYWWHMKSKNDCQANCQFDTKRPPLYRPQGPNSIEAQLDKYVTENLRSCLGDFEEYRKMGCNVQELGEPSATANIAKNTVFFTAKYPLRAVCDGQTFDVEESYVNIDLNLREIYELGTELANFQIEYNILEQATKNIIYTFSGVDPNKLPPPRAFEMGPPKPGQFWIKMEVAKKVQELLAQYIPLIQATGVLNYNYIAAPAGVRDPDLYEQIYNRQFLVPLNTTHPSLEARFMYLDWWKPYFDLNCNGQLCQSDTASNFKLLQFAMNRYTFAYDLSYPVMVEIRNPTAFNKQGYSFKFMLEQNMRNSEAFLTNTKLPPPIEPETRPSMFCNPSQQTSGNISIYVKDGYNLRGLDEASISYLCGNNNCNMGLTKEGKFSSKFPRCIGGTLRITKQNYASYSNLLDVLEEPIDIVVILEPVRIINVTIKNYALTKSGKWTQWGFYDMGALRPPKNQTATIMLSKNASYYEEPFVAVTEVKGDGTAEMQLIPGEYAVMINSFLKQNVTIPPDRRCTEPAKVFGIKITKKECYFLPPSALVFNETNPFPYGGAQYQYTITSDMLRGKTKMEFRQFVIAVEKVDEQERIIEDLQQLDSVDMYSEANKDKIYPVIT